MEEPFSLIVWLKLVVLDLCAKSWDCFLRGLAKSRQGNDKTRSRPTRVVIAKTVDEDILSYMTSKRNEIIQLQLLPPKILPNFLTPPSSSSQ